MRLSGSRPSDPPRPAQLTNPAAPYWELLSWSWDRASSLLTQITTFGLEKLLLWLLPCCPSSTDPNSSKGLKIGKMEDAKQGVQSLDAGIPLKRAEGLVLVMDTPKGAFK